MQEASSVSKEKLEEAEERKKYYIPLSLKNAVNVLGRKEDKSKAVAAAPGKGLRTGKRGWGAVGSNIQRGRLHAVFLDKDEFKPPTIEETLKTISEKVDTTNTRTLQRIGALEGFVDVAVKELVAAQHAQAAASRELADRLDAHLNASKSFKRRRGTVVEGPPRTGSRGLHVCAPAPDTAATAMTVGGGSVGSPSNEQGSAPTAGEAAAAPPPRQEIPRTPPNKQPTLPQQRDALCGDVPAPAPTSRAVNISKDEAERSELREALSLDA